MNITVVGSGYVGLVTAASLANLGHDVLCFDTDAEKTAQVQKGEIPFYEPGLKELLQRNVEKGRLRVTVDEQLAISFGDVLFNCVGTPQNGDGSANLAFVDEVLKAVQKHTARYTVFVNKSTVPPGTARKCQELLRSANAAIDVVSNPEFLKQGNAVYDFNHPDKIVIGASTERAFQVMRKVYHGLLKTYIPLMEMDWETAEMTKYANNAFLATKISFINEIANICSLAGADVKVVAKAIGMDQRIGPKFLNAGIGYGGSCFAKDVKALAAFAEHKKYNPVLLQAVDAVNRKQKEALLPAITDALKKVDGDTVSLWGLSFKPKTSDLREAPSQVLMQHLLERGIHVKAYDPVAAAEAQKAYPAVEYCSSIEDSVQGSYAIILATEWDEFRNVNFAELGKKMKAKIIFDGRNIYDPEMVREEGFEYHGVGRK